MARRNRRNQQERTGYARWTPEENERLVRQVRSFPQNLHKCFMIVADELGRSEKGVAAHWYSVVSKKPENMCFFTASPRHVSRNRKNGMGTESNGNIWRRLCAVLRSLVE